MSIRALLLALLLPGLVALLALDSWNDYHAVSLIVQEAYDQALLEPVQALDDSIGHGPDGGLRIEAAFSVQSMFEATRARHKYLHVSATLPGGIAQTLTGNADLPPAPPSPDGVPVFYDALYRGEPVRLAALRRRLDGPNGQAYRVLSQAAESLGPRQQAQSDSWHQALWGGARLVGLTLVLVWLGVALALRPLERLRRSLRARAPGNLTPLDLRRVPSEIVPLVEAVNHHLADHRRMLADQSRFLADASHQLRTPLAIMLTQASYAMREQDGGRQRESLQAIMAQLTRARRLCEQLLALAHASHAPQHSDDANADTGADEAVASAPARIDLNAVAREVVLQYLPLARARQQDLGWVDADGVIAPVLAHAAELHEALSNLLDNAIAYSPFGSPITVSVGIDAHSAWAEVCDAGPGIAPTQRARAFERFRRGATGAADSQPAAEVAGQATTKGAGLGLAIARAYARRNGGDIELADCTPTAQGAGLRATLRLPLAPSAGIPSTPNKVSV